MSEKKRQKEVSRGDNFTSQIPTGIWLEEPSEENPFIAEQQYLYGYNFDELVESLDYPSLLFLTITGKLISQSHKDALNLLMNLLITPGARHPASRAAMNAGIGRTHVTHILPISLSVLSSDYLGSKEVGNAMLWLKHNQNKEISSIKVSLPTPELPNPIPGFGHIFGSIDKVSLKWAEKFNKHKCVLPVFSWMEKLISYLNKNENNISWLPTGLAATIFMDLGIDYRTGIALFQFLSAPGLIAHGVEKANKPLTDMPFISEENYEIRD